MAGDRMAEQSLYGGIEAGGTKFVCAVGSDPENIVNETRFPTTTPAETVQRVWLITIQSGTLQALDNYAQG